MNINIKVYLHAKETNFLQSGNFPVPNTDFKKDPDWTAAVALNGFSQLKITYSDHNEGIFEEYMKSI